MRFICLSILFFGWISLLQSQEQTLGLFQNSEDAFNGYAFFSPSASNTSYLIDNCGYLINSWEANSTPGQAGYLLEDGSILRTSRVNGEFIAGGIGGRIERYNWDGSFNWGYTYANNDVHHHHDIEYMPNGNILLIAWERIDIDDAMAAGRVGAISNNGLWPDHVVEIKPLGINDAEIVWEWHLWDHIVQNVDPSFPNYGDPKDFPERIDVNAFNTPGGGSGGNTGSDWNHCNSIDYNAELDQIVLSSRTFSEFWIIDHSTTSEEAASSSGGRSGKGGDILYRWGNPQNYGRGDESDRKLYGQHDVHWIDEGSPDAGKIILFNNGVERGFSSFDILVPPMDADGNYILEQDQAYGPEELYWTSEGLYDDAFANRTSSADQLANGNILFCIGPNGRFGEIDMSGNLLWEYQNPVRNVPLTQGMTGTSNGAFRVRKHGQDYGAFAGRDLTPGLPIELEPIEYACDIYLETDLIDYSKMTTDVNLISNPVVESAFIRNEFQSELVIHLMSMDGTKLSSVNSSDAFIEIDLSNQNSGLFLLHVYDVKNARRDVIKLIKY